MVGSVFLKDFDFHWEERKILSRIGWKKNASAASSNLLRVLHEAEMRLPNLLEPKAVYALVTPEEFSGQGIFERAVLIALCVVTIGSSLEEEAGKSFREGNTLQGLVLDAFGSEAVVQAVRRTDRKIEEEARRRELWPSKRFCPGDRGWPLEEQKFLFSKVDAGTIGVSLNDSCMMVPRKSNSFRVNFYPERSLTTRRF
jgi:hypothetical protein